MERPKNKSEELRLAAKILWFIGVALTSNFILSSINNEHVILYGIVPVVCMLVQYAVTKITSAIFSGAIPPPWSKRAKTNTSWIWIGAVIILIMDVFINLGGVGEIARLITNSDSGDVMRNEFGASDSSLKAITGIFIIMLALLVAIGPELCYMYADIIEPTKPFGESKGIKREKEPEVILDRREYKVEEKKQESDLPLDLLAQLNAAKNKANTNQPKIILPNRRNN